MKDLIKKLSVVVKKAARSKFVKGLIARLLCSACDYMTECATAYAMS